MLGFQNAHWVFNFNSDASLLEGNRVRDGGAGTSPEFSTVGTVEGYSPLDQYLMGFLPPEQVEPGYPFGMFLVTGVPSFFNTRLPQVGVASEARRMRGYVIPQAGGQIELQVKLPAGAQARTLVTWANGRRVRHTISGGFVEFTLPAKANAPADWAVTFTERGSPATTPVSQRWQFSWPCLAHMSWPQV